MSGRLEIPSRRTGKSEAAIGLAAIRLFDIARELRFVTVGIQQSRVPGSRSRYVVAVDALGRPWSVRVSDHPSPADGPCHHHEVRVSSGGVFDLGPSQRFLARAAAGIERWRNLHATARRLSDRERRRRGRR